jgi:hypothetical protein
MPNLKSLLVIAHYFKAEQNSIYSSTNLKLRDQRMTALESVVTSWVGLFEQSATINIEKKEFIFSPSPYGSLDIIILVHENNHLIRSSFANQKKFEVVQVKTSNPRLLPFAAHKVMAQRKEDYDWFFYSEDDLAMRDSHFLLKLQNFQSRFGPTRILQPNRYEMNINGAKTKTFIDGDLRAGFIDPFLNLIEEKTPSIEIPFLENSVRVERTRNPHSGFFALTQNQLKHWVSQSHFNDLDCSFVSPLESGATLGILKSFSIFKASPPSQSYFEIEHLDKKFSSLKL